jgi:hypothetical protein
LGLSIATLYIIIKRKDLIGVLILAEVLIIGNFDHYFITQPQGMVFLSTYITVIVLYLLSYKMMPSLLTVGREIQAQNIKYNNARISRA